MIQFLDRIGEIPQLCLGQVLQTQRCEMQQWLAAAL
jgi:hypothetical protein